MRNPLLLVMAIGLMSLQSLQADPAIQSLDLINAQSGETIRNLSDGDTIDSGPFTIVAKAGDDTASVVFQLTGPASSSRTESTAPFTLTGDTNGNFAPASLPAGKYRLSAVPRAESGGKGKAGAEMVISFVVSEKAASAPAEPSPEKKAAPATEKVEVGELKKAELKNPVVAGEMERLHKVTLTFEGPEASEDGELNPFRDYRMEVQFIHDTEGIQIVVPGHFAADGNAAETGATSGNRWRVHFTPEMEGDWRYWVWFRKGKNAALSPDVVGVNDFEEPSGRIKVAASSAEGPDFRARGVLRHPEGER